VPLLFAAVLCCFVSPINSRPNYLTFDELLDSTFVTTQYAGLTLSNGIVLQAGSIKSD
jgi:hypothetical protein